MGVFEDRPDPNPTLVISITYFYFSCKHFLVFRISVVETMGGLLLIEQLSFISYMYKEQQLKLFHRFRSIFYISFQDCSYIFLREIRITSI